ncbi:MAG: PLP-dependent aspartate aminotransferase family protein [Firmicutes bacterium]|nr:PLP-dependent aspartate aminotransferase family protein [Bacillota bacterium]
MEKETLYVHGHNFTEPTGAVSVPIYQSATFKHVGLNESTGFDYSRLQNPTRQAVEHTVAALEGGADAIGYSSGMAAITALMELFSPGGHIVSSEDLYGGAIRFFRNISAKNGLSFSFTDTSDLVAVEKSITQKTKAIFIETPTNPMMIITDIEAICRIAKPRGIWVIVDNTFLTPHFLQPLKLGADIVVHSGTKFLGGHNDTLAGFSVFKDADIAEKARFIAKTIGACLSPFDSWLLLRGIKTLAIRMERAEKNAFAVAEFLQNHKRVNKVFYAGLPSHKGYGILKKQATGFGSMVSFEVDSHETLKKVLKSVKVLSFAESLGGVESLITYPAVQTHADVPELEREKRGINDRLLRISVGIENEKDIIADLKHALE